MFLRRLQLLCWKSRFVCIQVLSISLWSQSLAERSYYRNLRLSASIERGENQEQTDITLTKSDAIKEVREQVPLFRAHSSIIERCWGKSGASMQDSDVSSNKAVHSFASLHMDFEIGRPQSCSSAHQL